MTSKLNEMIWSEKYRPKTVEECILPKATKTKFHEFVSHKSIPNLLLSGSAGTGKTTAAYALANELDYEVMVINGSNEGRLLDNLRSLVTPFCSSKSFDNRRKLVVYDESDYIPAETVQPALRNFIDSFPNCSFIFTCNFPGRIIEPIKSRLSTVEFSIPSEEKKDLMIGVAKRVFSILEQEGIVYDKTAAVDIIKAHFPDFRRILNEIQSASASGELNASTIGLGASADLEKLPAILKSLKWNDMRTWVGTQANLDLAAISRLLYTKGTEIFKQDSMPQFILTTAEYQYKNSFVVDKEINVVAYLTALMTQCEFK
jgi:DNA polymerase III delta prime subunit